MSVLSQPYLLSIWDMCVETSCNKMKCDTVFDYCQIQDGSKQLALIFAIECHNHQSIIHYV